ncbi:MAG: DUF1461 domain-containing protein [Coriobacteriales bacterium]|jgi:integral membrane protein (TIGR01906 family)|nr:DUF1461 domain-containing protein [Coriobacteriales bacterium]
MRILATVLCALFCPLAALMITLSPPVTHWLAEAYVDSSGSSFSHEQLVELADAVRDFSLGNDQAFLPTGTDYRSAITAEALTHLLDVRVVFLSCEAAAVLVMLALVICGIQLVRRRGLGALRRPLIEGGAIPLCLAALLALAVWLDFTTFFRLLHGLFFAAGSWVFPADSLLIRALPEPFWLGCALVWTAATITLCLVCVAGGFFIGRRGHTQETAKTAIP